MDKRKTSMSRISVQITMNEAFTLKVVRHALPALWTLVDILLSATMDME